ncbi:proline-rich receptor-like protein kinase PERK9 [Neodiprion fabricii]|uniref:proline-rich receptor-like protein kinase PERK9 n=1 Tax=Neodiprion fabricii TaxID=2872261 RepID=UPI001ED8F2CF|nr:proline-rich receptor-like protein kinase PERK9 [Neodiprion fabricii]
MDDPPALDDAHMTTPTDDSDSITLPTPTQPINPAPHTDDEIRDATRPSNRNPETSATGAIRKQPPEPQPSRISPRNIPPEFLPGNDASAKPAPVQQPPLRSREYHPVNPPPFDYRTGNSPPYEYRDAPPLRRPAFRNQGFEDGQYNFPRPSMNSNLASPSRPTALAAYEVMRKWNLKFSGTRNEDAEAFLARIDEGRSLIKG